jgi:multicomponent Na+:H+ antiporter subunit G
MSRTISNILIIVFFWLTSPIATHMIAKVELLTNKDAEERMREK